MKCKTCKSFSVDESITRHSGSYHSYSRSVHFCCTNREARTDRNYECLKGDEVRIKIICKHYKRSILKSIYHTWKIFWVLEYELDKWQREDGS